MISEYRVQVATLLTSLAGTRFEFRLRHRLQISLIPKLLAIFRNMINFYGEEVLAPRTTPKLGLSATAYSIYSQLPFISVGCSSIYKVVQIWPGLFVCKQVTVCSGHIWTTLYNLRTGHAVVTGTQNLLSSSLLSRSVKIKIYRTVILSVFCMVVKLGRLHWGRNVSWGFPRIRRWGGYLGLRRLR